jgi:hypothetical protein
MKIGREIEVEEFEPRIIPVTIPERIELPEEEPIEVPAWPMPVPIPVTIPEKQSQ